MLMSFTSGRVQEFNGVPALFVGGSPVHGMTATSCAFDDPQVVRDFAAGGVEIMMIWIEAGIHCWKGPGQYDWSYAEKKLAFFAEHSGNTHWIIRVRLGLVDPWFRRAYPDEVHNPPGASPDAEFSVCNIASSVWRDNVCQLMGDFTKWLESTRWSDRIIGFMLNAGSTEEWLIFDSNETIRGNYQTAYVREFRRWLRSRYGTDSALKTAWNMPEASLETVKPPDGYSRKINHIFGTFSLLDPALNRPFIDYYYFLNETLAENLEAICRSVKEAAGTPIVCGGFHSYLWWETGVYSYIQEYGHTLLQRLKESPWIDFISDITSYDCRYPGGPSGYLGLPHSINLDGKLHYTEVDLTTVASLPDNYKKAWEAADAATIKARTAEPAIPNRIWQWDLNYCGRDMDEQLGILQREHMHNLITGTPYWWFDIRSHNYQAPEIIAEMKKLSALGSRAVHWNRGSCSQVAFIVSEDTPMYQSSMSGELIRFELESLHGLLADLANRRWGLAGIPFDTYELKDLAKPQFPGEQYKLMLFVNCAVIPEKAAEGIRRWQCDGRVMVWTHAAGVIDGKSLAPGLGAELIGMKLGWRNERQHMHVHIKDTGHALTRGGETLDFWSEGSMGPVFFAADEKAVAFGRLTHGGEPAFSVREHGNWTSVHLSIFNFGPQLLRNLAEFAGAHIWCTSDDVIYANHSLLCLHTASAGVKQIRLPAEAYATDLWTGERTKVPVASLEVPMQAYRTRAWRLETR